MGRKPEEHELFPDAWERFERAASVVAKSPPQHRDAKSAVKKVVKPKTKKPKAGKR